MNELTRYRIAVATERLDVSKIMLERGGYKSSVSCAYFSIFDSIRALLAEEQTVCKTFMAIVRRFRRNYIKTSALDEKFSDYFDAAFKLRYICDYGDFAIVSREQAELQHQHAVEFVAAVKNFLVDDTAGD